MLLARIVRTPQLAVTMTVRRKEKQRISAACTAAKNLSCRITSRLRIICKQREAMVRRIDRATPGDDDPVCFVRSSEHTNKHMLY
jgi:hypothetical protein